MLSSTPSPTKAATPAAHARVTSAPVITAALSNASMRTSAPPATAAAATATTLATTLTPSSNASARRRAPMNVVIPMGGIGSRFAKSGYRYPKPLINIAGRPMLFWLIENLNLIAGDTLWLAVLRSVEDQFHISKHVQREFKHIDVKLVVLDFETRGAAETLFIVCQNMEEHELSRRTMSLDCSSAAPHASACMYFEDKGSNPVFSYIALDKKHDDRITAIREKVAISQNANTGAYVFATGHLLHTYACQTLDAGVGVAGEYYTSSIIASMIQAGEHFVGCKVDNEGFCCVGTPSQLDTFLQVVLTNPHLVKKRRFCFDLDNTLVSMPRVDGDYTTCEPKWRNIRLCQQLKAAGHYIIIQTARRMKTHNGNVGAVIRDIGTLTIKQLADFGIDYDELLFGKPWAHLYIDDLAVNALLDTGKEIGWYMPEDRATESSGRAMVAARDFNQVQVVGDKVVKASSASTIHGEAYFYACMPNDVSYLFPTLYDLDYNPESSLTSITMGKLNGITFSHLLVSRCLTESRFATLLKSLQLVHKSSGLRDSQPFTLAADVQDAAPWAAAIQHQALSPVRPNIYANYGPKAAARLQAHASLYKKLGICPEEAMAAVSKHFDAYQHQAGGYHCKVIHGDPVFSNVLMTKDGQVKFIDMRGRLGNDLTLEGDALYDLAKVYQSLCGYDFIILDREMSNTDKRGLGSSRTCFGRGSRQTTHPAAAAP
ncbi:nucleotide-diphospho-sugar transferase [Catenaria anguillulae PL171]|uniref:Nucleotide-diphospho-sugar transferase n=1 Tax=Catenaria anguillulae PL171 TaxID=765915 RepID=A0A1Y2H668_9FUNG|nr:nucleotide-diphospho-sugar transferase [Catenaria anguillulae PL171]